MGNSQAPVTTYEAILGQVLRQHRERASWGQAEMAKRAEVTQPYWSKVELGRANPSHSVIRHAAQAFGITHSQLIEEVERSCAEARARGVRIIDAATEESSDWLPFLGAAALGALIAIALSKR